MENGPDKGQAWFVAAAVFTMHLILSGIFRSQGVFFVEFINVYGIDRKKASVPFSLYSTIRHLVGPVVGIMGQKYGCHRLIIIGAILGSMNAALCFFAKSIEWYIILWGIMNGLATSLTTILPQVVLLQYFIKYRTTAMGLGFTGGCVGSFLFPVILEVLLNEYGINGTFLVLASIMMNTIPFAIVLRSPEWSIDNNGQIIFKNNQTRKYDVPEILPGSSSSGISANVSKHEPGVQINNGKSHDSFRARTVLWEMKCKQLAMAQSRSFSCSSLYDFKRSTTLSKMFSESLNQGNLTLKTEQLFDVDMNYLKENTDLVCKILCTKIPNSKISFDALCSKMGKEDLWHPDKKEIIQELENMHYLIEINLFIEHISNISAKPNWKKNAMGFSVNNETRETVNKYHKRVRLQQLGKIRSSPNMTDMCKKIAQKDYVVSKLKLLCDCNELTIMSYMCQYNPKDVLKVLSQMQVLYKMYSMIETYELHKSTLSLKSIETGDEYFNENVVSRNNSKQPTNSFKHHIKAAINLHTKAIFILICCTRVAFFVTFSPVLTFIVDFAMDKGFHEEDGKYILGALSFGDILGRMCLGWITDRGYATLPRYMFMGMTTLSVCIVSMPLFSSRWIILLTVALFAMLQGSLYVRHPGLVGKYLNLNEQSIAIGCMDFFSGIITLFVPLYIGYFRDHIGSYDTIFYINGSLVLITAIGWFFESHLVKTNNDSVNKNQSAV